jgi:hypothetical protein
MIRIRTANEDDKSKLLRFVEQAAGSAKAERLAGRWEWQWHRDPRLERPGFRGVVAEWDGKIIGNASLIPAALYIGGAPRQADWLVDVRIDRGLVRQALKAMRRAGVRKDRLFPKGLAAAMFDEAGQDAILLGKHIGEDMMAIGLRDRFEPVPQAGNLMRRVSFRWPLQKALTRYPGAIVAWLADLALPRPPPVRLNVRPLDDAFDQRFDRLWERARQAYPAIALRNASVLNWHYRQHPDTSYRVLVLENPEGLRGYLVFKVWVRKGRLVARIVDLLTEPGDRDAMVALFAAALREMRARGAERADCFACGEDAWALLPELGFRRRLTKSGKLQPLLARGLPDIPLYVTSGDGDGG